MSAFNQDVARRLREAADLLELQGANQFRVAAYRRAADTVAAYDGDIGVLARAEGEHGLIALPGIGRSIAASILEIARTGRWSLIARLRGAVDADQLFQTLPGVGPALAHQIHESLEVESLDALAEAADAGRLESVPGIGPRRAAIIKSCLNEMLRRAAGDDRADGPVPSVAMLLDIDRQYRDQAASGALHMIAPRRFNPDGKAWLPILHAQTGPWHVTALYSNTARAHEYGRIGDWVVIHFHTDDNPERQCTVVTEWHGPLAGKRVVRGREIECRDHYIAPPRDAASRSAAPA